MYVMQVHARTGWVSVADLEKMLHKVRWALGEVSLYSGCTTNLNSYTSYPVRDPYGVGGGILAPPKSPKSPDRQRVHHTSAAGGAPSKCSDAAFVCGLVASLAASPELVGQSGGVERVEREDHESAIHLANRF